VNVHWTLDSALIAVRGHLRTNAAGANLNREWASTPTSHGVDDGPSVYEAPTLQRSPEVYHVLNKMIETGVDVFVDVHGDEAIPYNFLSGAEGTDHWADRLQALHGAFLAAYVRSNSDMQSTVGYPPAAPGKASRNVATRAVANRFNCLSVTLEMPFKDCASHPDPDRGWCPSRARMLGASLLEPLSYIHPYLRDEGVFWESLPSVDEYIAPVPKYK
jgi:murein tripeptide amidase MpaA